MALLTGFSYVDDSVRSWSLEYTEDLHLCRVDFGAFSVVVSPIGVHPEHFTEDQHLRAQHHLDDRNDFFGTRLDETRGQHDKKRKPKEVDKRALQQLIVAAATAEKRTCPGM